MVEQFRCVLGVLWQDDDVFFFFFFFLLVCTSGSWTWSCPGFD